MPARIERALCLLDRQLGRFAEAFDLAFAPALLGDAVQLAFRALDLRQRRNFLRRVERTLDHVAPDRDEGTQQGEIVNLLGEITRADDRRTRPGKLGEIGRPADLAHRLVRLEHRPQGHRIGDHILVGHAQDGVVDAAVQRLEIMVRTKLELDILDQPIVDHQRAKERRLCLNIVRQDWGCGHIGTAIDSNYFSHGGTLHQFVQMAASLPKFRWTWLWISIGIARALSQRLAGGRRGG